MTTETLPPPSAASTLSEAELLAQRCGNGVTRLNGDWKKLLKEMPKLGKIRCHTGNRAVLNNRFGPYRWVRFIFNAGQTGGPEVDLRLFMKNWKIGFVIEKGSDAGLQFFNKYGDPIHKIFLLPESNVAVLRTIASKYRNGNQNTRETVVPRRERFERPDHEIDIEAFRTKWRKMWDTHQFYGLHKKFGLGRLQALRLAPPELVRPLPTNVGRTLFEVAAKRGVGFMTFSGNAGCLQIHNGKAHNLALSGEWFTIRDADFHLDIHEPSITHAYEVRKPTLFGIVSSIELFDEQGDNVAVFYGKRGRLEREHEDWRELVRCMPSL